MAVIELENVSKTYPMGDTQVHALRDLSVSFRRGEFAALMGPSGSGKSTILNLVGALDFASTGEVRVSRQVLSQMSRNEQAAFRNRTIGFIFQNFNLIPVLTALENVLLPSQLGENVSTDADQRAADLLTRVGLGPQKSQRVNRLSGGQMQRVAIARALMNKPPVVLADEPTANLDHKTSETVLEALRTLAEEEETTVLVATHDPEVLPYCNRVIKIADGALISDQVRESNAR